MTTPPPTRPGNTARQPRKKLIAWVLPIPVVLLMIVIAVDAGLLLARYLALLDASRQGALYGVSVDPFLNPDIYARISNNVVIPLVQRALPEAWEQDLDVLISVFSVDTSGGDPVVTARYPDDDGWSLNDEGGGGGDSRATAFSVEDVNKRLRRMSTSTSGILLVEVWFDDHLFIGLPFIPAGTEADHVRLHAYAFMPITRAPP